MPDFATAIERLLTRIHHWDEPRWRSAPAIPPAADSAPVPGAASVAPSGIADSGKVPPGAGSPQPSGAADVSQAGQAAADTRSPLVGATAVTSAELFEATAVTSAELFEATAVTHSQLVGATAVSRSELVQGVVQQLADLGAEAENRPPRPVPHLHDLVLRDQLRVLADDILAATPAPDLLDRAAAAVNEVRRRL
ncbi:hypothetical protein [Actinoplanes xinjiangensis]|uniref:Uncharacterized protein n=1 Tax=Actinoplanes xinjiangensis TaxID=512350 RepID=A0A316F8P7_9ACTN|nr:hypothetical protein [Actinoplanes xinjiangensis]PWK40839.1 hypothetical protein BC793_11869 [Actinoplanes xinjiangensis]GIF43352.1 hypothetical protein Axi01nite_76630 [Actinoplanes xinjiangensis]